jgi:hypothetical protein
VTEERNQLTASAAASIKDNTGVRILEKPLTGEKNRGELRSARRLDPQNYYFGGGKERKEIIRFTVKLIVGAFFYIQTKHTTNRMTSRIQSI